MVAEPVSVTADAAVSCSLAKISMVAEHKVLQITFPNGCSLAKISMVAELNRI